MRAGTLKSEEKSTNIRNAMESSTPMPHVGRRTSNILMFGNQIRQLLGSMGGKKLKNFLEKSDGRLHVSRGQS